MPHGRPTDPAREAENGRIPVWLDPEDVQRLARICLCENREPGQKHDFRCKYMHMRIEAALDKAGLKGR